MRALVYTEPNRLGLQDVPAPERSGGDVLVRPTYVGICGTDLHLWHGEMTAVRPPVVVGHEIVGVVAEDGPGGFAVGDRVAVEPLLKCGACRACREGFGHVCRRLRVQGVHADGGAAESMPVSPDRLHRIPDGLAWEVAAVTEPTAVAVHMLRRVGMELGDVVLVLGGGPIGYLVASVARAAGAGRVLVSEVSPYRIERCRQAGLEVVDAAADDPVQVIRDLTDGEGADVVVEAAGHPATVAASIQAARVHGTILIGGIGGAPPPVDLTTSVFKELTLVASRVYESRDMDTALALLAAGAVDAKTLVTRVVLLEDAVAGGFEPLQRGAEMKVLLTPG
jgi:(R,R)-butanediol dehydrogenase/meso-butanediol dehydrogenase/diacetyl reductase